MRKILCTMAAVIMATGAFAQALPSLLIPSDAASLSLAGATVAGRAGALSVDDNAASMALSGQKMSVAASFGLWQPSAGKENLISAGGWWNSGRFAIGASFRRFGSPSQESVSVNGTVNPLEDPFAPSDMAVSLGASFAVTANLSLGLAARFVNSKLTKTASANVVGADISVMYSKDALRAGLVVANLGSKVKYSETAYAQPMVARAGASYTIIEGLTAQAELSYLFAGAFGAGAGVEYGFRDMVFARAGFHYGSSNKGMPTYASLGLGGKFAGVRIDAAYLLLGNLTNTLMFTLGYSF